MRSTTRLRFLYFALAAVWGFVIGAGTLGAALSANGSLPRVDVAVLVLLVPGGLLALVGGIVSAAAYRDARRRIR